jgi:hypothetical protein
MYACLREAENEKAFSEFRLFRRRCALLPHLPPIPINMVQLVGYLLKSLYFETPVKYWLAIDINTTSIVDKHLLYTIVLVIPKLL